MAGTRLGSSRSSTVASSDVASIKHELEVTTMGFTDELRTRNFSIYGQW
jgi:hypothetical protein